MENERWKISTLRVAPLPAAKCPMPDLRFHSSALRAHSLFWLLAANTVGLLLSTLLLFPELNTPLAPLTYGRWMPLHHNWHLYGWCSLPMIAALLSYFSPAPASEIPNGEWKIQNEKFPPLTCLSLWAWSLALALGGLSWLNGTVSGKLFLDWHGWARPLLPAAMLLLWVTLAHATFRHFPNGKWKMIDGKFLLLAALLPIPFLFYWACSRDVYPTVNPHSGGATGTALLGSTLAIVALFAVLPTFLRVPLKPSALPVNWPGRVIFALSALVFALSSHGHATHHDLSQVVALGTLLAWGPLGWYHIIRYEWRAAERPWLRAAFVWWLLLLHSGWLTFLPELSERLKFTHALVAHSHLAMAGLITSAFFVILQRLDPTRPLRGGFWLWQLGTAAHVIVLTTLGWLETENPTELFTSAPWTQTLLALRLLSGLALWTASLIWFLQSLRKNCPI